MTEYRWARRVAQASPRPSGPTEHPEIPLTYGFPDPTLFPAAGLAEATARIMSNPSLMSRALQYGRPQGNGALIGMLVEKLRHDEGLDLSPESILISTGSSGAIGLVARTFINEGDTVLVEAPSFPGAMGIFRRTGAELRSVPMGDEGLDFEAAARLLETLRAHDIRPSLLYTMPTFHNPTGVTVPEAGRRALLDLARQYDFIVLEDDAYHDLYYDEASAGPLPPSLLALDGDGRVVRTGTFSKILAPGMRLGWALARPEVIEKMLLVKDEGGSSGLGQQIAVEYSRNGALTSHIAMLVDAYRNRRDAMLSALERYFPPAARWTKPLGGFFVWVTLPASVDPGELATLAHEEGVDYMAGDRCFAEAPPTPATYLRLSFSTTTPEKIEEGIRRLSKAITSLL